MNFQDIISKWVIPILVALIPVIFGISKYSSSKRKQKIGNINNSNTININGDVKNSSITNKNNSKNKSKTK